MDRQTYVQTDTQAQRIGMKSNYHLKCSQLASLKLAEAFSRSELLWTTK